jgi:arginyl-tRNA synthetase
MGALKFMLLKVNAKTTMMFDPAASIQFEGDTGPYVQYACARIASLLRKAGPDALRPAVVWNALGTPEEKELALRLAGYGQAVRDAAAALEPSGLVNYLLDLAKAFSRFYLACPVIAAPDPELRRARLELCVRTRQLLKAGLETLTIGALDAM